MLRTNVFLYFSQFRRAFNLELLCCSRNKSSYGDTVSKSVSEARKRKQNLSSSISIISTHINQHNVDQLFVHFTPNHQSFAHIFNNIGGYIYQIFMIRSYLHFDSEFTSRGSKNFQQKVASSRNWTHNTGSKVKSSSKGQRGICYLANLKLKFVSCTISHFETSLKHVWCKFCLKM